MPPVGKGIIRRNKLAVKLSENKGKKLTLVSASAGFGKSTLLADWAAKSGARTGWLSLDGNDNDPAGFLRYLVAVLREIRPDIGRTAKMVLKNAPKEAMSILRERLLEDLSAVKEDSMLVLDDYHTIESPAVHELVEFLVTHSPPQFHMVIATRSDPPFRLSRLRVQSELLELRNSDLAFNTYETTAFFREMAGVSLSNEQALQLKQLTEGWVAGLQLAGITIKQNRDISSLVKEFQGSQRFIIDFLSEEVLAHQPDHILSFLLETSVLDQFSAELCDFVTGGTNSFAVLGELEKQNLFLVPLDDRRCWYRYHNLFKDLLLARLKHKRPESEQDLHRRASRWLERDGQVVAAVSHALAAEEYTRARRLAESNIDGLLNAGEVSLVFKWLAMVPELVIQASPLLCVQRAWLWFFMGQAEGTGAALAQAEQALEKGETAPGDKDEISGNITVLKALACMFEGKMEQAFALAEAALALLGGRHTWAGAMCLWIKGIEYHTHKDLSDMEDYYGEMIRSGRKADNAYIIIMGMTEMSNMYIKKGKLSAALNQASHASQTMALLEVHETIHLAKIALFKACVMFERNHLDKAEKYFLRSVKLIESTALPTLYVSIFALYSKFLCAVGEFKKAGIALEKAEKTARKNSVYSFSLDYLEHARIRLWLADKSKSGIKRWKSRQGGIFHLYETQTFTGIPDDKKIRLLHVARILMAEKKYEDALALLGELQAFTRSRERIHVLIDVLILKAMAHHETGAADEAAEDLAACFALAEPEGYVRKFLEEGPSISGLLEDMMDSGRELPRSYVRSLLSALKKEALAGKKTAMVEPLSDRELEVLNLLSTGMSNKQIMKSLSISLSTVNSHVRNIYGKLDVHSRTEAAIKARELNLIR